MKQAPEALESISLRRAQVADADKVRYRVYRTPTDFVAVIAESALLAMKAAGVKSPHKIVRDLPTDGIAIEAKRMAEPAANDDRVVVSTGQKEAIKSRLVTEVKPREPIEKVKQAEFKAITLGDLQRSGLNRARILSPQMLSEIIDEFSKVGAEPAPPPEVVEPVVEVISPPPVPAPALIAEATPEALPQAQAASPAPASPPEPEVSQEEKVMQLASEILPSAKDLPPAEEPKLSQDEVNKLLNE